MLHLDSFNELNKDDSEVIETTDNPKNLSAKKVKLSNASILQWIIEDLKAFSVIESASFRDMAIKLRGSFFLK